MLDRRDRIEKAILFVLKKCYTQYYNAFQNISRNTRFIYVHAYQSFVWNRAVTARLQRFGKQVLLGDLVIPKEKANLVDNQTLEDDAPHESDDEDQKHPAESKAAKLSELI